MIDFLVDMLKQKPKLELLEKCLPIDFQVNNLFSKSGIQISSRFRV